MNKILGRVGKTIINNKIISAGKYTKLLVGDPLVKIAILSTIAGYLETNNIEISDCPKKVCSKNCEKFLSFLLNHKGFAPVKYNIKIKCKSNKHIYNQDNILNYDNIILFSGGMDSSAALLHALDSNKKAKPILLWVGFGQKNELTEDRVATTVAKQLNCKLIKVNVNLGKYIIEGWAKWDYIVPARNFIFSTIAACLLSVSKSKNSSIIMGVHQEEFRHSNPGPDKSPRFFKFCSKLYSDVYKKNIILETPFKNISKTELAAHWKNVWINKYKISPHDTISCYFGNYCGKCNACFKRSLSFTATGLAIDKKIKYPFSTNPKYTIAYIKRAITNFKPKRRDETLSAFFASYKTLPRMIQLTLDKIPHRYTISSKRKLSYLSKFTWRQ